MYPNLLSLICALLLTLPLAIVFTINTTTIISTPYQSQPSTFIKTIDNGDNVDTNVDPDADDTSLFKLASSFNPYPSLVGAPKKLAFMVLTTGALPLAPLWELYFSGAKSKNLYNIYIHADPKLKHENLFQGVFTNRTIPSKLTLRRTPSLIAAHRRLLARALLHDPGNYMFVLVSPSCIPLHSFHFTYKTLINSNKSFIEILEHDGGAWGRYTARGGSVMLPEVKFELFRIGSQFSILTRQHAKVAVSDTHVWSKFKLPCPPENLNRCYPEESYLPTLLFMVDRLGCVPATLTYVDWKGHHDGHPHTFHGSDVGPDLIRTLRRRRPRYGSQEINGTDTSMTRRNDPFLFARKFGSDTVKALLDIANDVILKE